MVVINQHCRKHFNPGERKLGITGRNSVQITMLQNWQILKAYGQQNRLQDKEIGEDTVIHEVSLLLE